MIKRFLIPFLIMIILSGCDRGKYYDTGPVLIDKQIFHGRAPNIYPEKR